MERGSSPWSEAKSVCRRGSRKKRKKSTRPQATTISRTGYARAESSLARRSRCSLRWAISRSSVSLSEPVASPAWMRLTVEGSNTAGNSPMARESGAPSLRRSHKPPLRVRSPGSLMRTESSRTASPADMPLVRRSCSASRNGSRCLRVSSTGGAAAPTTLRAARPPPASWTATTCSPRAARSRSASLRLGASSTSAMFFPLWSRAL